MIQKIKLQQLFRDFVETFAFGDGQVICYGVWNNVLISIEVDGDTFHSAFKVTATKGNHKVTTFITDEMVEDLTDEILKEIFKGNCFKLLG